jgi:hypothetical protein
MAIKMIPVYECDKCDYTTENPDNILLFGDSIFNGDKSKIIIDCSYNATMLCSKCVQENFNMEHLTDIEEVIEDLLEDQKKEIELVEEIILEPNQDNNPAIQPQTSGKYLILCKIENEAQEEAFAQMHSLTLKDLKSNYGNSLKGLYVKTGEYYINEIPRGTSIYLNDCNIVNKLIFGVPNIINKMIHTSNNSTLGYIELKDFDFQFEEIKYDKKEETHHLKITGKPEEIKQEELEEIFTSDIFETDVKDSNEDTLDAILNASIKPTKRLNDYQQFNDDSDI